MTVVCPTCGAKNHIPDPSVPGERYRCGKCKTRLTLIPKARDARDERSATLQVATAEREKKNASVVGIAFLYLVGLAVAEALLSFLDSPLGAMCHVILLIALIIHSLRATERRNQVFLLSLALVPLVQVVAIIDSQVLFVLDIDSKLAFSAIVCPLSLAAAVVIMRIVRLRAREVGFALGKPLPQLLVGLTGIIFGPALYYVSKPEPLVPELDWGKIIIAASVILIGAVAEELIFRGILQRTSMAVFGIQGVLYVSLLFALLHFGGVSGLNVSVISIPFIFAIALFYSWAVKKTGSLFGVTLSHFILNIIFFLVAPLAF